MEILQTKRLIIRNFIESDIDTLFAYRNDKECSKYQRWDEKTHEQLREFIKQKKTSKIGDESSQFAITLQGEHIGDIFLAKRKQTFTIGYTIAPAYQRQGYASEVVLAMTQFLLDSYLCHEIVALVEPQNAASVQLLNKLGFTNEGYDKAIDSIIFSKTKKEIL